MEIPKKILYFIERIKKNNFEIFLVGGGVRDFILGREGLDWDFTTNAKPEDILNIFPDAKYENDFGTVLLPEKYLPRKKRSTSLKEGDLGIIEITTYRVESKYSDKRHPDVVRFAETLEEDLSRRDFTINAMAMDIDEKGNFKLIDLFEGQLDLKKMLIRAVGDPNERFDEDALRMMRAIRFAAVLGFKIEEKTFQAIKLNSKKLRFVSKERIKEEFEKIILSKNPALGVNLLVETGLMWNIIPEIMYSLDVGQNHHHYHGPYNTVYKHLLASLKHCPSGDLEIRLAAFLHDIGKPRVKKGEGEFSTFYGHEYMGAKMAKGVLERLKFPRKVIDKVVLLVKNHMFYYNIDEVGEAGVRRLIKKVGLENVKDLIDIRVADRLGSGVKKAIPYKLRHFQYMVEKVSNDPVSVKDLKLKGGDLMKELTLEPGPKIGAILDLLLAEVLDDPILNNKEELLINAKKYLDKDLKELRLIAKKKIEKERGQQDFEIKKKHWVK